MLHDFTVDTTKYKHKDAKSPADILGRMKERLAKAIKEQKKNAKAFKQGKIVNIRK